jgi:Protein of unknown function (DUF1697)
VKRRRYVAFLRAINVGGRVVKMATLKKIFEHLKLAEVETFIASGNVIFTSPAEAARLETAIEKRPQKSRRWARAIRPAYRCRQGGDRRSGRNPPEHAAGGGISPTRPGSFGGVRERSSALAPVLYLEYHPPFRLGRWPGLAASSRSAHSRLDPSSSA